MLSCETPLKKTAIEVFKVLARWLLKKEQKRTHTEWLTIRAFEFADMAELVDALDLGSSIARCDGFESLYPHQRSFM